MVEDASPSLFYSIGTTQQQGARRPYGVADAPQFGNDLFLVHVRCRCSRPSPDRSYRPRLHAQPLEMENHVRLFALIRQMGAARWGTIVLALFVMSASGSAQACPPGTVFSAFNGRGICAFIGQGAT